MLKWAVNAPRLSYLTPAGSDANDINLHMKTLVSLSTDKFQQPNDTPTTRLHTPSSKRQRFKRKSSDCSCRLHHWVDQEDQHETQNQVTSTPLHSSAVPPHYISHPLRRLNSLRNLSNIIADAESSTNISPQPITTDTNSSHKSGVASRRVANNPSNYASTLPTLEVEYSPCGIVPGSMLVLRGLGIADMYIDKPRYLLPNEHQHQSSLHPPPAVIDVDNITQTGQNAHNSPKSIREDSVSLSSSKMGDQTLERMIDSILHSTRKENKPMKFVRQSQQQQHAVMSPTYTAAEDPANDLYKFCGKERYEMRLPQPTSKNRHSLPTKAPTIKLYSEREVRSPVKTGPRIRHLHESKSFHLRRQRAVRRKNKSSKSIANPLKKYIREMRGAVNVQITPTPEQHNSKTRGNPSPDSGHNSCSELDENSLMTLDSDCLLTVDAVENEDFRALDATKRRLIFSNNILSASQ